WRGPGLRCWPPPGGGVGVRWSVGGPNFKWKRGLGAPPWCVWGERATRVRVRSPVVGCNLNWKMALGPPRLSMWGTKANVFEESVWIAWAPMAVSNHTMGGPPTAPSGPTGWTAAWAP